MVDIFVDMAADYPVPVLSGTHSSLINLSDVLQNCESNVSIAPHYDVCKYEHKTGKYKNSRITYYADSNATFQLELCGDIENNPGPVNTNPEISHPLNTSNSNPSPIVELNYFN